jgi:arylsulfatase B
MLRRRSLPGGEQGRMTPGAVTYTTHMGHDEPPYDANNPILRGGQPLVEETYLTDAITREAVEFIGLNAGQPFFLYVAYNAVHSPLQGADEYMIRFASIDDIHRRIFAAMLSNLDDGVGRILAELRDRSLERETLVFFLSDNGGPTRELTSSNKPLRGEKSDVYEGGIRVPFMMRWPGRIAAGGIEQRPVISLDIAATALAAAGAEIPGNFDGVDLMPFLNGGREGRPHETLYWRQGERTALREGDWKLLRNPRRGQGGDWELYNLEADISESNNRAGDEPERVAELKEIWLRLDGQMAERAF